MKLLAYALKIFFIKETKNLGTQVELSKTHIICKWAWGWTVDSPAPWHMCVRAKSASRKNY